MSDQPPRERSSPWQHVHPDVTTPAPRWSIVIPLYNMAATIGRAIDSVVTQSETDWELIVVDDGSIDGSAAIVTSFADQRISLVHQVNAGKSAARNRGVESARAPLVTFLDADDRWGAGHLANLERLVEDFPDAILYATAYQLVYESGEGRRVRLRDGTPARYIMADYFAESVDYEVPVCASGVAVRKSDLQRVGGFPTGVHAGEDLMTWARLACLGAVAYSTEPTSFVYPPPVDAGRRRAALRRPHRPTTSVSRSPSSPMSTRNRRAASSGIERGGIDFPALTFAELGERRESLDATLRAIKLDRPTVRDGTIVVLSVIPNAVRTQLLARNRLRRRRPRRAGAGERLTELESERASLRANADRASLPCEHCLARAPGHNTSPGGSVRSPRLSGRP